MKPSPLDWSLRLTSFASVSALVAAAVGCSGSNASVLMEGSDAASPFQDGDSTLGVPVAPADDAGAYHDASRGARDASDASDASTELRDAGACTAGCKLVFVTSGTYTGDLHGSAGADGTCRAAAATSSDPAIKGRAAKFIAWISAGFPGSPGPSSRLVKDAEYRRADGVLVAASRDALLGGSLLAPIDVTEHGDSVGAGAAAWTGTTANGTTSLFTCNGWSTQLIAAVGDVGAPPETSSAWTAGTTTACNASQRLYCIEAGE